jgi:hypothetical protein
MPTVVFDKVKLERTISPPVELQSRLALLRQPH